MTVVGIENEERQCCSICGSNHLCIQVKDTLLCQECLLTGNEKINNLWQHPLDTLFNEYTDYGLRCVSADDPEDVHQARVTGRKIRAILEFLGVSKSHELLQTIKKMHHLLSKVREADVFLLFMQRESETNTVFAEMTKLISKKRKKRQNEIRKQIPDILNSEFFGKVKTFMNEELAAYTVPLIKEHVIHKHEEKYKDLVEAYHRTVEEKGTMEIDSIKALHTVRIQSKSLRYIYHYLNEMPGEDYQDKIDYYKGIQNQFGEITDIQDWLFQLTIYEKKINAPKHEIEHVKKKLKTRLQNLIEKVDLK